MKVNESLVRFRRRNRAYREIFMTAEGRRVMRDLHQFCMQPVPSADANEAVFAMGMQRVFRRIAALSGMKDEALLALATTQEETDHDE